MNQTALLISIRSIALTMMLFVSVSMFSQVKSSEPPRLLVGIKIDGLKPERVNEYWKSLSVGGFRKIITDAVNFENVNHLIVAAGKAPDVATYMTGTYPFFHGVSSDTYLDRTDNKIYSILYDENQTGIGTKEKLSAHKMLASTITDEIVMKNPLSKVHSIAIDAENAIMLGGHAATSVSWIDKNAKRWITTAYYAQGLSKWADMMNVSGDFRKFSSDNALVNELALTIFNRETLGSGRQTDALMIQFAMNGVERKKALNSNPELDAYINLDNCLQQLIYTINTKLGADNVLFFIVGNAADIHSPIELGNNHVPAGLFNADRALALLNTYLMAIYGQEKWIAGYYGKNIFFNKKKIEEKKINWNEFLNRVTEFVVEFEGVHSAYSAPEIFNFSGDVSDPRLKFRNSFHKNSSGDVVIALMPGWVEVDNDGKIVGDTNSPVITIPFYMMGAGLKQKVVSEKCLSTDIAPTISRMLMLPNPNACVGNRMSY